LTIDEAQSQTLLRSAWRPSTSPLWLFSNQAANPAALSLLGKNLEGTAMRLEHLGIGEIVFIIGALIYVVNLLSALLRKRSALAIDGIGLMVLGLGLSTLLRL